MSVFFYTDRGNKQNEDFVYGNDTFGFILDGASGLGDNYLAGMSDAQVFSHFIGGQLITLLANEKMATSRALMQAVTSFAQNYRKELGKLTPDLWPSATFSCYRKIGTEMEFSWLGDSPITAFLNQQMRTFYDRTVPQNDQRIVSTFHQLLKKGETIEAAKAAVTKDLVKNRQTKNTPNGYAILDPSPIGIARLSQKSVPADQLEKIVITSDGFYRLVDTFNECTPHQLGHFQDYGTLVAACDHLRKLEGEDAKLLTYPRFKQSDDASVLVWQK
ncbi:hypothetical protein [Enterococcus sp. S86.2]|uniref:hypothetical protein n=1 Tax=Enterococcus sp. S86.2 TaxID=3031299 RepID=UPI0026EDD3A2|nr:hypothetical protein [Enterococcus sp. S86.2]